MRTRRLLTALAAGTLLLATQMIDTAPASADVVYSGTLDPLTDPTMAVVTISNPNCVSQGSTQVHYDAYPFSPATSGPVTVSLTGSDLPNTSMYVFEGSFTPAAALSTCIAGANSNLETLTVDMTVGTQYYVVVFDDTFAQAAGKTYTLTIDEPAPPLTLDPAATTEVPTTGPTTEPPTTEPPVTEPPTTQGPPVTGPSNPTTTTVPPATRPATGARPVTGRPTFTG